jgi:hypothetical protein
VAARRPPCRGSVADRAVLAVRSHGRTSRRPGQGPWGPRRPPSPGNNQEFSYGFSGRHHTLGFVMHGFWAGKQSSILGVWAAPAAPKAIPKSGKGGFANHRLAWLFGPPGPPRLQNRRFPAGPQAMDKNPSLVRAATKSCCRLFETAPCLFGAHGPTGGRWLHLGHREVAQPVPHPDFEIQRFPKPVRVYLGGPGPPLPADFVWGGWGPGRLETHTE